MKMSIISHVTIIYKTPLVNRQWKKCVRLLLLSWKMFVQTKFAANVYFRDFEPIIMLSFEITVMSRSVNDIQSFRLVLSVFLRK